MESNLDKIEGYWTLRADGYSETILEQIEDGRYRHWLGIIEKHLPEGRNLRILDESKKAPHPYVRDMIKLLTAKSLN